MDVPFAKYEAYLAGNQIPQEAMFLANIPAAQAHDPNEWAKKQIALLRKDLDHAVHARLRAVLTHAYNIANGTALERPYSTSKPSIEVYSGMYFEVCRSSGHYMVGGRLIDTPAEYIDLWPAKMSHNFRAAGFEGYNIRIKRGGMHVFDAPTLRDAAAKIVAEIKGLSLPKAKNPAKSTSYGLF